MPTNYSKAAKWLIPIDSTIPTGQDLSDVVDKVIAENKQVREVFAQARGNDAALRKELEYSVLDSYNDNRHLRRFSQYIDTMDKSLVPFDVLADATKIFAGVGYGLSTAKEIVEMTPKLAYLAYYTAKTKDFVGAIGNLLYEGLSWFLPGSLLDLTNRYVKQADKYVIKNAAKKFLRKAGVTGAEKAPAPAFNPALNPSFA